MPIQKFDVARPDGAFEEKYWSPLNTPVLDDAGRVAYIIHRVEDVTQAVKLRESVERALSLTESQRREIDALKQAAQFQLFVRSVKDYGLILLDAQGRVASWNEGAERNKGYREHEIVGKPYETFFTPEDIEDGTPGRLLAQAAAQGHVRAQGWRVRKDGTRFWADVTLTALRGGRRLTGGVLRARGRRAGGDVGRQNQDAGTPIPGPAGRVRGHRPAARPRRPMNLLSCVHFRYTLLGVTFFLASVGYAGWVAYVASMQQIAMTEETQRLIAENAQAASAAAIVRAQRDPASPALTAP